MIPRFQESAYAAVLQYLTSPKPPTACLCLVGGPGTGKSYLVDLAAAKLQCRVVIMTDDDDDFDLGSVCTSSSLFGKRLVVFDEPTAAIPAATLTSFASKRVIVLTTNLYEGPMKTMRQRLSIVRLHDYSKSELACLLSARCSPAAAQMLADQCAPDMRYALIMLDYATRTAKAKRPGAASILTATDCEFSLFADVQNAFAGRANTGVGSADFFMYAGMLQTNCVPRTKKLLKVLDGFTLLDLMEVNHAPVEVLVDTAHSIAALCGPSDVALAMPKFPSCVKKEKLLRRAAKTNESALVCYERLRAIDVPDRLTKKHPWYDEDPDVRALLRKPFM